MPDDLDTPNWPECLLRMGIVGDHDTWLAWRCPQCGYVNQVGTNERKPVTLSPYALRALAEIDATGLWNWTPGLPALLDDPQKSTLKSNTIANLIRDGFLEETGDSNVIVTEAGLQLLQRNPEAHGRAAATHEAQQVLHHLTGMTIKRGNPKSTPRP